MNEIKLIDCLEHLHDMGDETIDLVLTSPPYNKSFYLSGKTSLGNRNILYDSYSDNMNPKEYDDWQKNIIDELMRVLKPTGSIMYNHKYSTSNNIVIAPKYVYDYPLHEVIIWDKNSSQAMDNHYFQPCYEQIYWIVKDPKQFYFNKNKCKHKKNIWRIQQDKNNSHPAPFPLALALNIVSGLCPENGVVYDPFMGSGTTALATVMCGNGRKYIGSEISKSYKRLADDRIKAYTNQLKLNI